ncbi:MAG: membrane dipeptidase [Acidobacteria bacterium]|nr:membrane dipeptidase [Acidobacteriota bacterium]
MRALPCLLLPFLLQGPLPAQTPPGTYGQPPDAALTRAKALLTKVPLVDGHNDLPWEIRESKTAPMDVEAYDLRKPTPDETDLARLKAGRVSAQFWSVYVPGELGSGFAKVQLEQLDIARRMIARYPEALLFATRSSDIAKARKAGKVASFIGMEGGHVIENSLGALRMYYDLGARYMTLTHNVTLDWADAALGERKHGGLTPFGKEVVREMNRLGMMVDISHVSPEVMRDVLDTSEAPVIFSHSCARALVDHPRNVPDAILARMARNGGVVMVTFIPPFVNRASKAWYDGLEAATKGLKDDTAKQAEAAYRDAHPQPRATTQDVADHIDHVAKVAGKDHVGIACDFAGMQGPVGLEDASTYPNLFAELMRRGWTDEDLTKLAGGNMIRTFAAAEKVSERLRKERKPSLAQVSGIR